MANTHEVEMLKAHMIDVENRLYDIVRILENIQYLLEKTSTPVYVWDQTSARFKTNPEADDERD